MLPHCATELAIRSPLDELSQARPLHQVGIRNISTHKRSEFVPTCVRSIVATMIRSVFALVEAGFTYQDVIELGYLPVSLLIDEDVGGEAEEEVAGDIEDKDEEIATEESRVASAEFAEGSAAIAARCLARAPFIFLKIAKSLSLGAATTSFRPSSGLPEFPIAQAFSRLILSRAHADNNFPSVSIFVFSTGCGVKLVNNGCSNSGRRCLRNSF